MNINLPIGSTSPKTILPFVNCKNVKHLYPCKLYVKIYECDFITLLLLVKAYINLEMEILVYATQTTTVTRVCMWEFACIVWARACMNVCMYVYECACVCVCVSVCVCHSPRSQYSSRCAGNWWHYAPVAPAEWTDIHFGSVSPPSASLLQGSSEQPRPGLSFPVATGHPVKQMHTHTHLLHWLSLSKSIFSGLMEIWYHWQLLSWKFMGQKTQLSILWLIKKIPEHTFVDTWRKSAMHRFCNLNFLKCMFLLDLLYYRLCWKQIQRLTTECCIFIC